MSKRVIVSVTNDLYTDQRVDKVCLFLVAQGYDVLLVGRKRKKSLALPARIYKTKRMRLLFDKGALFYAEYNFRLFLLLLFRRVSILVSNDLDTLLANYTASKFKPNAELVYDTHEYFTEVPELQGRRAKKIWEGIEAWIFPRLTMIYTVNESIASVYKEKYKKELKIVRNISPLWKTESLLSKVELGIPTDRNIIIIQGAGINVDRGAEEAVEAMKGIENCCLLIVGDGDVVPQLKEKVSRENLQERVLFFGRQPYKRMMNYTHHADLGLTLDKDSNANYKFSLPNKVFDYIHTETPILSTNLIEITRIINEYHVGFVLDVFTVDNLSAMIKRIFADSDMLAKTKENCKVAKSTLNWESETTVLSEIYPKVD